MYIDGEQKIDTAVHVLTFNLALASIQTHHSINLFECDYITRLETMHLVVQRCHNARILLHKGFL